MYVPLGRKNFDQEARKLDDEIDLGKAALYIAQEEYHNLDISYYIKSLDDMAAKVKKRLPSERYPLRVIQTINQYLYDELGYKGNTDDYYDPRNSFFNDVIERHTGIPITLSLLYLEIARRLNFAMVGINMPGHFLIRPDFQDTGIFIDAFNQGEILFQQDCEERLKQMYGHPVPMQSSFIEAVGSKQILARILTNLKFIYLNNKNWEKALAAVQRIMILFPESLLEMRDRGLLYYHLGNWYLAYRDLKVYSEIRPNGEDADLINRVLEQLRRRVQT
jgi:regulator of sirC expression with transglutaminase-like and TPR domain